MRSIVIIISFLFIGLTGYSQFGFSAKYEKNNYRNWTNVNDNLFVAFDNEPYYKHDLTFGANYWFRLKNKRVEFLPEVSYTLRNSELGLHGTTPPINYEIGLSRIGLQFNTQIYPMDLSGDCNCPTWGKDGDFLKKGFYFTVSPGLDYFLTDIKVDWGELNSSNFMSFKIGVGAGIDIGINNLITVSPFFLVNFYPSVSSDQIHNVRSLSCPACDFATDNTLNTQLQLGVRVLFRPDYKY